MRWPARTLLSAYALLALFTADCLLRPAWGEEPGPEDKFRMADRDGSGRLEAGELPQLPAVEFARADRDHDGGLDLVEVIRWKALDDARKQPGKRAEWREKFRAADKDGDGRITKAEFPAPEMLFERFDRDGDGQVGWDEALRYGIEEEVAKLFEKHDADLSGTLTRAELPPGDAQALFLVADADRDGQVTGEELGAFLLELTREVEGGGEATPPSAPPPPSAPAGKAPGSVLELLQASFSQADQDQDGALSAREFPGSRELLERMDVDRDGQLSRGELELRLRRAAELGQRGAELRQRARAQGLEPALGAVGAEGLGLYAAGRLEELARLLDEIDLWLARQAPKR